MAIQGLSSLLSAQPIPSPQAGVTDGGGNVTFTFAAPPLGFTNTATICMPTAPPTAGFIVSVGGNAVGAWQGNSTYGPIQQFVNQTLVVVASGLLPYTEYLCAVNGYQTPAASAPITWPESLASAQAIAAAISTVIGTQGVIDELAVVTGPATTVPVVASHAYEALMLVFIGVFGYRRVSVTNNSTGITSLTQELLGQSAQTIVPTECNVGDTLTVNITPGAGAWTLIVLGLSPSPLGIVRSDGRTSPIGAHIIGFPGAPGDIVTGPGGGLCIFLHTIEMYNRTASAGLQVQVTINGVTAAILSCGVGQVGFTWAGGLLLDTDTSVVLAYDGTPVNYQGSVVYDYVI